MAQSFSTTLSSDVNRRYNETITETLRRGRKINYFQLPKVAPSLNLVIGPMFAGKTTELAWRMTEAMRLGKSVLLITSSADSRYPHMTHDAMVIGSVRTQLPVGELGGKRCVTAKNLLDVQRIPEKDVFIDEGHFFTDLPAAVRSLMGRGKNVTVAMLNGTTDLEPFTVLSQIIPFATTITHKTALCVERKEGCQVVAPYFQFKNGRPKNLVGGAEKYKATCWNCANT